MKKVLLVVYRDHHEISDELFDAAELSINFK